MGSREVRQQSVIRWTSPPLCGIHQEMSRQRAAEWFGVGERTSPTRTHHETSAIRKFGKSSISILIFPAHRIKPLQGKNQGITDVATGTSGFARCISICSRRDVLQLVHLRSSHRPQGGREVGGIKQTGQHPLSSLDQAGPRGVAGGHQDRSMPQQTK